VTVYRDIYDALAPFQDGLNPYRKLGVELRLIKVQEEAGEVAQALIGFVGGNKRKGVTHDEEAVAKELADVVVTAMVALHDWVPSPEQFMQDHLRQLMTRIREEGS
jgi:phosphoribosyl-ATP pyrophosphohydrolase